MAGNDLGMNFDFINLLPFANLGFCWVVPAIIGGLVGFFIKSSKKVQDKDSEEIAVSYIKIYKLFIYIAEEFNVY